MLEQNARLSVWRFEHPLAISLKLASVMWSQRVRLSDRRFECSLPTSAKLASVILMHQLRHSELSFGNFFFSSNLNHASVTMFALSRSFQSLTPSIRVSTKEVLIRLFHCESTVPSMARNIIRTSSPSTHFLGALNKMSFASYASFDMETSADIFLNVRSAVIVRTISMLNPPPLRRSTVIRFGAAVVARGCLQLEGEFIFIKLFFFLALT